MGGDFSVQNIPAQLPEWAVLHTDYGDTLDHLNSFLLDFLQSGELPFDNLFSFS